MCLTVNAIPQVWQIGGSSLAIRKPWVIQVCPMRSRIRTIFSFLVSFGFVHRLMSPLILFNLVFCKFQSLYHLFLVYSIMNFFESAYNIWFISKVSLLLMAIEACSSAISLPYDYDFFTQNESFIVIVLDFRCNVTGVELVL